MHKLSVLSTEPLYDTDELQSKITMNRPFMSGFVKSETPLSAWMVGSTGIRQYFAILKSESIQVRKICVADECETAQIICRGQFVVRHEGYACSYSSTHEYKPLFYVDVKTAKCRPSFFFSRTSIVNRSASMNS